MAGLYTQLVSGVLFPLQERIKGHTTTAVRRAMEASQWWSPQRLEAHQTERLRGFLGRIGQSVPYYCSRFQDVGFEPDRLSSVADLAALPLLTKADIRAAGDSLKSVGARNLVRFNTGGSSGEPLIFHMGRERVSHDVAAKWRATRWWGVDIGDPEVVVWGSPIEVETQDRIKAIRDRIMRTRLLPAFEMSPEKVDGFLDVIGRMRPKMLFGYPSALAHIAQRARDRGRDVSGLGIEVAFVTAERLYDHQRDAIAETFGCEVANGYGGRDAGFIAHQCPNGGMHITAEDIVVEIVDAEGRALGPGEAGEVVTTHLATADFPFVRYRTGDVAVLDDRPCPCGRGLPLLAEVQGRTTDFVVAGDGTVMHGLALIYVVRDLPGVRSFKIIQESLQHTRVLLVTDVSFADAHLETIRVGFRQRLGEDVQVSVERVDEIPAERSGKFRYVVSRVDVK